MNNENRQDNFIPNLLPWILGGLATLIYLLTMGHGLTLANLGLVTQLGGCDWPQNNLPPLLLLVTLPLRWLSMGVTPLTLNFFSALTGGLTLVLLARSVALLPHDRTQAQRDRERSDESLLSIPAAWLPVVLAVVACALQLSFWECSADGSGKILDALLFMYPVRCLLEFRLDGRQSWLAKAAFVFGLGMANNWLMVFLLPAFLVALLWLRGLAFFNLGFLVRMTLAGWTGTAFCLLLPLAQSAGAGAPLSFGDACHAYFAGQKAVLTLLPLRAVWVLSLTSLLPVAVMAVRWASSFGDNSPMGIALAGFMFHLVHGVMLATCLWTMFDSPLSPRGFLRQSGDIHPYFSSQPWLPFYLLAALAVGYFSGYFLLVFNNRSRAARNESGSQQLLNTVLSGAVWVCLVVTPIGLFAKNISYIHSVGSRAFSRLGQQLVDSLPKNGEALKGLVVLSDDQRLLLLTEALLQSAKPTDKVIFLNTASLPYPAYHRFLKERHPRFWSYAPPRSETNAVPASKLTSLLLDQSKERELYYLHPSFGYYFESFYAEPKQMAYRLQPYPAQALFAPAWSPESTAANDKFWKTLDKEVLPAVIRQLPPPASAPKSSFAQLASALGIKTETDARAIYVGACYSRALNAWGKDAQARQDLPMAGWAFQRAVDLNPMNVAARINRQGNQNLQAGGYQPFEVTQDLADLMSQYASADQMQGLTGPFDEPRFTYPRAVVYLKNANYRQAAYEFSRVKALAPDDIGAYVWLGYIYNLCNQPDEALAITRAARSLASRTNSLAELVANEATAYFAKKDPAAASRTIEAALRENPADERLENSAVQLFMKFQAPSNALAIINRQLERRPDDLAALNNHAVALIRLGRYEAALPSLNKVIAEQPTNHVALLNRAIAQLQCNHLPEAREDYTTLTQFYPAAHQLYYGLGEIAYRRQETAEAIRNYTQYLAYAPADSEEGKLVKQRLEELKARQP